MRVTSSVHVHTRLPDGVHQPGPQERGCSVLGGPEHHSSSPQPDLSSGLKWGGNSPGIGWMRPFMVLPTCAEWGDGTQKRIVAFSSLKGQLGRGKREKQGILCFLEVSYYCNHLCIAGHDLSLYLGLGFIQSKPVSHLPPFCLPASRIGSWQSIKVQILQNESSIHSRCKNLVSLLSWTEAVLHSQAVNSICRD